MKRPKSKTKATVVRVTQGAACSRRDVLATEEPLEIRLLSGAERRRVAVTMRTPGSDFELAAGFLFCEGILGARDDIERISYCVDTDAEQRYNIVNVALRGDLPDLRSLERHFYTSSACGVCGKANLEALEVRCAALPQTFSVSPDLITSLPDKLRNAQGLFEATGGLHAAALFTKEGELLEIGRASCRERVCTVV